jgi:hypothetical protein
MRVIRWLKSRCAVVSPASIVSPNLAMRCAMMVSLSPAVSPSSSM